MYKKRTRHPTLCKGKTVHAMYLQPPVVALKRYQPQNVRVFDLRTKNIARWHDLQGLTVEEETRTVDGPGQVEARAPP